MDKKIVLDALKEAALTDKEQLKSSNIFKEIGFDGTNGRLGWYIPPKFEDIQNILIKFLGVCRDKSEFIFIGMGGSINGIKTLINLSKKDNLHALDSLDTEAIDEVLSKIKDFSKTLVCPISKSGTTKETQLIAQSIKEALGKNVSNHFLWITDPGSFSKLDAQGWQASKKLPIQVDGKDDIGGRFASPHTLIFLLPLILIFGKDIEKLKNFWSKYTSLRDQLLDEAYREAERLSLCPNPFFQIEVKDVILEGFSNWAIQLFEESLGSKIDGFFPKAIVQSKSEPLEGFNTLKLGLEIRDNILYTACVMYFLEVFVALIAYNKKLNFVNQPSVEIYKKELKSLNFHDIIKPKKVDLEELARQIKSNLRDKKFIDCVLYFDASSSFKQELSQAIMSQTQRHVSIFIGSDWNHHSYQAAFKDTNTLFVILVPDTYRQESKFILKETIEDNTQILRAISYATYKTLQNKSLYLAV